MPSGAIYVNPDETDSDNRVTTGEGIVAEAVAEFDGSTGYLNLGELDVAGDDVGFVFHYTPGSVVSGPDERTIVGKWTPAFNNRQVLIRQDEISPDRLILNFSHDGGGGSSQLSDAGLIQPGDTVTGRWLGLSIDVDDGAGNVVLTWWDGGTGATPDWSVHNTDTIATTTGLHQATGDWWVGAWDQTSGPTDFSDGKISALQIFEGLGANTEPAQGTKVFELTPADLARGAEGATEFPASTGQSVTVEGDVTFRPTSFSGVEPTATFDGVAGSREVVPDEAAFQITGSLGLVAKIRAVGATTRGIAGRYTTTSNLRSWRWGIGATRQPYLWFSVDGAGSNSGGNSTIQLPADLDTIDRWVSITLDDATGDITHWDGGTGDVPVWAVHETRSTAYAGQFAAIGADLLIGHGYNTANEPFDGDIPYFALYDGIGDNSAPGLGTKVFERNQADIARAAAAGVGDGENYQSVSGHTVTSHGGVTYAGNAPFVIPADADGLLMWAGVVGNQTGDFPSLVFLGGNAAGGINGPQSLGFFRRDATDEMRARHTVSNGPFVSVDTGWLGLNPAALDVFVVWVDRDNALLHNYRIQPDGTVTETTVDISSVGAILISEGLTSLLGLPGAVSGVVLDAGDTYTEEDIREIARQLHLTYEDGDIPRDGQATILSTDLGATILSSNLKASLA